MIAKVDRLLLVLLALVIGSLVGILALIPGHCGMPSPDWLFVSALFTFSFRALCLCLEAGGTYSGQGGGSACPRPGALFLDRVRRLGSRSTDQ